MGSGKCFVTGVAKSSNRRAISVAKNARLDEHLGRDVFGATMVYIKHGKGPRQTCHRCGKECNVGGTSRKRCSGDDKGGHVLPEAWQRVATDLP